jgi:hypothetical protein
LIVDLLYDALSISEYIEFSTVVIAEWKGYGRKRLWHNPGRNEEA